MSTTYGTCHFVSHEAAVAYYKAYEQDPHRAVALKLDEGSIRIGKPSLKHNQTLTIIDDGLRYAITEKEQSLPDCPRCKGETEMNGTGGFVCFFCGLEFNYTRGVAVCI